VTMSKTDDKKGDGEKSIQAPGNEMILILNKCRFQSKFFSRLILKRMTSNQNFRVERFREGEVLQTEDNQKFN
jgi:hypothetical protein